MTDSQRQKRIEKAQYRILFNCAFFAPGVSRLPVRFDASVPTACTDGKEIVWNPEFFDKLPDECLPTVLAHETAHCLLGHLWRMPVGGDCSTWNQAADHAVNLMLEDFGKLRTAQNLADPFPFPKDFPALKDPKFAGMCEEQIYGLLSNQGGSGKPPPSPQGQGSAPKTGPNSQKPSGGAGNGQSGQSGGKPQPSIGEFKPAPGNPAQQKQSKTEWDSTLIQSAAMCKGQGSLPGSVQRAIGELLNPKVSWQELLRNFLREQVADDWDFMRPNQYFDDSEFILPSLNSEAMGAVVFATDWSGSINRELVNAFEAEKQSCLDDLKPSKLVDMIFDTRVSSTKEYRRGDTIKSEAKAGGGTDFRCIFSACEEMQVPPKCLVVLTDLQGAFPDKEPPFPTIWIVYDTDNQAPFGETVRVK